MLTCPMRSVSRGKSHRFLVFRIWRDARRICYFPVRSSPSVNTPPYLSGSIKTPANNKRPVFKTIHLNLNSPELGVWGPSLCKVLGFHHLKPFHFFSLDSLQDLCTGCLPQPCFLQVLSVSIFCTTKLTLALPLHSVWPILGPLTIALIVTVLFMDCAWINSMPCAECQT